MIRFLSIRDLAVIDRIEVEFLDGFNVLTGETGAGKSIIVGALGLLVGGRATNDLVRTGCEKAVVEGIFEDVDGEECVVRREISAQGRSRIYVDDELSTVTKLKQIGKSLVDIHGQHEHQALLEPKNHLRFLDAYAGHSDVRSKVSASYREWRKLQIEFEKLTEATSSAAENLELLNFQLYEIDTVGPAEGEDDSLEIERSRLANAERLSFLANQAYEELYESDSSVVSNVGMIWRSLEELEATDKSIASGSEEREMILSGLSEISEGLRSYATQVETSPERLAFVEQRLASLEGLKRKYGGSMAAVFAHRVDIQKQIDALGTSRKETDAIEKKLVEARETFVSHSAELTQRRLACSAGLESKFTTEMAQLAIADCGFRVAIESQSAESEWDDSGVDRVEFFFSANAGEELRPLARTASGGELSRVMLALKTLGSTDDARKTLVFDEVDAGVGGAAAERIGQRLCSLGRNFQVLSVTHAAQVALHGDEHFSIRKAVEEGRTITAIKRLSSDRERAAELSRLMTGGLESMGIKTAMALIKAKGESERRKS